MPLADKEIIKKFNIKPTDKVLDIGGSMKQHPLIQVDTLVDIISPEKSPYGKDKLSAKHFVRLDITKEKLPFKDKEFDFVLCTHTLEDLHNPFLVISEMSRVGKRGYITTPSFGADIVYSHFNLTDWLTGGRRVPGWAHHKWLFSLKRNNMQILPKNYPLLYTPEFQITGWYGEPEFEYYWESKIEYQEVKDLDFQKLIHEYRNWMKRNESKIRKGRTLFFIDNPYYFFKEWLKLVFKKGEGFSHNR